MRTDNDVLHEEVWGHQSRVQALETCEEVADEPYVSTSSVGSVA